MSGWDDWIGRSETAEDRVSPAALAGLAALLDHDAPPWPDGEAPPLFHWLHFLPHARQSTIDRDGHPRRGGFLPPVDLPRRMWAGSRLRFLGPVPRDAVLRRVSTIRAVAEKQGASGRLVFVTVAHTIVADGVAAIEEEQDIVYRAAPSAATPAPAAAPAPVPIEPCDHERALTADPVLLFRFSALTFNAHRIHYDRDYARDAEGYPGLVVHGPLIATLLMDHALRHAGGRRPASFAFSATRPLIDGRPFALCLTDGADGAAEARLWSRDADGATTMRATLAWAPR